MVEADVARWIFLILFLLGVSLGLNVGQWRLGIEFDRYVRELRMESEARNHVAEEALNLLADSKYQIQAAKSEAARRLRNKEDGRR